MLRDFEFSNFLMQELACRWPEAASVGWETQCVHIKLKFYNNTTENNH